MKYENLPLGKDIRVVNDPEPFSIDVKRFNVPACVTAKCPFCDKEVEYDFNDDYLSYPDANVPIEHVMYCGGEDGSADHEFKVRIQLTLKVEVVP